jgi:phosphate-selective porin OprO and OprP
MSDTDLIFMERGLPTDLVPQRDVGVQVSGDLLGGDRQLCRRGIQRAC